MSEFDDRVLALAASSGLNTAGWSLQQHSEQSPQERALLGRALEGIAARNAQKSFGNWLSNGSFATVGATTMRSKFGENPVGLPKLSVFVPA